MTKQILHDLEGFVRTAGQVAPDDPGFTPQTDLWEEGYLDSNGVVELIAFIESSYSITVPVAAMSLPEFTRLEGIATVVGRLRRGEPIQAAA